MTHQKIIFYSLMLFLLAFTAAGCEEEPASCYDAQMEKEHSGICLQDCPGVCGCDGNTYCNECIANSKGIRVVADEPCK